jgi:hypothetical protein
MTFLILRVLRGWSSPASSYLGGAGALVLGIGYEGFVPAFSRRDEFLKRRERNGASTPYQSYSEARDGVSRKYSR